MKLYVVYDLLAEESGPVIEQRNDRTAWRAFCDYIGKSEARPADFELYCIGMYDHDAVKILPCEKRRVVEGNANGAE